MKILFFLFILLFTFTIIFINSNTWETRLVTEKRGAQEYFVTKHSIHWDRFFDYIKSTPQRVGHYCTKYLKKIFK